VSDAEHERDEGKPVDHRPFLFIPYWKTPLSPSLPADNGIKRPLPSSVISWLCDGIHAGPYFPGQTLDVTVDVGNAGGGNNTSLATVIVYWADPTVGFVKPTFFGATLTAVPPRGGLATTSTISAEIPKWAPNHICLLAVVTHPLDAAGSIANPVGDRHWAQRNLTAVAASISQPLEFVFTAANPLLEEAEFLLLARPLDERRLVALGLRLKATPVATKMLLKLQDQGARLLQDRTTAIGLKLAANERRLFRLTVELGQHLEPHEFTAVDVVLWREREEEQAGTVGSLGLVILGERR
jgi:hypothetical protein